MQISDINGDPRAPMTAKHLQDLKFSPFDGPFKKEQTEAVLYIEHMASLTNVNISTWDILETFTGSATVGKLIVTDKRAINKRLYEHADLQKNGLPATLQGDQKKLAELSTKVIKRVRETRKTSLETSVSQMHSRADERMRGYLACMKDAWGYQKELLALTDEKSIDLLETVTKICQTGFWTYEELNERDGYISFINVNPVVIKQKNTRAGIDLQINLGYFQARLHMVQDNAITLHTHKENQFSESGYWHPYVSINARICWGNASSTADGYLRIFNYVALMELLSALLTTYSPDATPYASIESFHNARTTRNALPRRSSYTCELCEQDSDNCDCWTCEICSERFREGDGCNCCQECNNTEGNCECCGDCGEIGDNCERCRECDLHDGHARGCSSREVEPTTSDSPF